MEVNMMRKAGKEEEEEQQQQQQQLNNKVRHIWNKNAAFWDVQMGDGNDFQRILLAPALERLLQLSPTHLLLEIGCGNGAFARRLASLGIKLIATDFSHEFIRLATSKHPPHSHAIDYRIVDATDEAALLALGTDRFDAIVCNMALMDMANIHPLMRAVPQLLKKPHGRFVFSVMHPCFNNSGSQLMKEQECSGSVFSVKVWKYLDQSVELGEGMVGQPEPHYYFHRPLHVLLNAGFERGLVVDGIEEPGFGSSSQQQQQQEMMHVSWKDVPQIPPVLILRMRIRS